MRYFLPLLLLFIFSSCGNTFYIVRHAEKARPLAGMSVLEANNPPLSDSGQLRAVHLKELLKNENVQHIFSTNFKRTISTAQPLSDLPGSARIEIYSAKKDSLDAFIQQLKLIKKGNVLVVGHSNTVDDIVNKICGQTEVAGDLKDYEYDNLFILKRKGDHYKLRFEKYGKISSK